MAEQHTLRVIARIHSDFPTKFGIPRQSGLVEELRSAVVFEPEYRNPDALRGLEGFSHLWLIWQFSQAVRESWSPTVRPPRLGGNVRMGVFATRSPSAPTPSDCPVSGWSGSSSIPSGGRCSGWRGADLMDGTPIYDVKPYLPYADCRPEAVGASPASPRRPASRVECPLELLEPVEESRRAALLGVLAQDPRPTYQHDPDRVYGLAFGGWEVKFTVAEDVLTVREIAPGGGSPEPRVQS